MELNLLTAKCKARWPKDFDAKTHIRQKKPDHGRLFYIRNYKGILCYAVMGRTIKLHGEKNGGDVKVEDRQMSIYANIRLGQAVKNISFVTPKETLK